MNCATSGVLLDDYHKEPTAIKTQYVEQALTHAENCKVCWKEYKYAYCFTASGLIGRVNRDIAKLPGPISPDELGKILTLAEIQFLIKHVLLCCYCELLLSPDRIIPEEGP